MKIICIGNTGADDMTNRTKSDATPQPELGFLMNHKELLAIRVRPAEFARMLGVSKQTVSTWIRDGKVTINTLDGLLDVRRAIQDVLRNTSPGRLRSRVLRQAVTDALELRQNLASAEDRATTAEAALRNAEKSIAGGEAWIASAARALEILKSSIVAAADELRAAPTADWPAILNRLELAADEAADVQLGNIADPEMAALDRELDRHFLNLELDAEDAEMAALDAALRADPATAAEFAALDAALQAASLDALHGKKGEGGE
ncbi:hypothetical protein ACFDAU_06265 [Sulfuriferula sp. GW1]|uniref:hypothetical protein n=1 Tax=Sulfuriferula sp. GW1 TaxID=3345111 RepID=UPI0039AF9CBF